MTLTNGKPGENRACRFRHVKSPSDKSRVTSASHKLREIWTAICTIRTRSEQTPAVEPRIAQTWQRARFRVSRFSLLRSRQGRAHGTSWSDACRDSSLLCPRPRLRREVQIAAISLPARRYCAGAVCVCSRSRAFSTATRQPQASSASSRASALLERGPRGLARCR